MTLRPDTRSDVARNEDLAYRMFTYSSAKSIQILHTALNNSPWCWLSALEFSASYWSSTKSCQWCVSRVIEPVGTEWLWYSFQFCIAPRGMHDGQVSCRPLISACYWQHVWLEQVTGDRLVCLCISQHWCWCPPCTKCQLPGTMPSYDSHTLTAIFVWCRTHRHSGWSASWAVFHTDTLWLPSITVWLSSLKITWLHWTAIAQRLWSDIHESRFLNNTLVHTISV